MLAHSDPGFVPAGGGTGGLGGFLLTVAFLVGIVLAAGLYVLLARRRIRV